MSTRTPEERHEADARGREGEAEAAMWLAAQGWRVLGVTASPVEGGDGNREFLVSAGKQG